MEVWFSSSSQYRAVRLGDGTIDRLGQLVLLDIMTLIARDRVKQLGKLNELSSRFLKGENSSEKLLEYQDLTTPSDLFVKKTRLAMQVLGLSVVNDPSFSSIDEITL